MRCTIVYNAKHGDNIGLAPPSIHDQCTQATSDNICLTSNNINNLYLICGQNICGYNIQTKGP